MFLDIHLIINMLFPLKELYSNDRLIVYHYKSIIGKKKTEQKVLLSTV